MPKKIIDGEQYEVVENYDLGTNVYKGGEGSGFTFIEASFSNQKLTINKTWQEVYDLLKTGAVIIARNLYEEEPVVYIADYYFVDAAYIDDDDPTVTLTNNGIGYVLKASTPNDYPIAS